MQDQEAADPRPGDGGLGGGVAIYLFDASLHQIMNRIVGSSSSVRGVSEVAPLSPIPDRFKVDVDEGGDNGRRRRRRPLFDVGKEFELVSMNFGANSSPPSSRPTSLARSRILS